MNRNIVNLAGISQITTATEGSSSKRLARGQVVGLKGLSGSRVLCTEGVLWLTTEDDLDDHILEAGQSFTANRPGKLVMSSLDGGAYRMA